MLKQACVLLSLALLAILVFVNACSDARITSPDARGVQAVSQDTPGAIMEKGKTPRAPDSVLDLMNRALAEQGLNMAVAKAEVLTANGELMESGQTLFATDQFLRLGARWVPGDARRNADGDRLTYVVDQSEGTANPGISTLDTEAAIDRSFESWQDGSRCSGLILSKRPDTGEDATVVDALLEMGDRGDPFLADIVNAGFMPAAFFDRLTEDGSQFILAVAFTLVFLDEDRHPTDINNDGHTDVSTKEVYYNDAFRWSVSGSDGVDVETVALHENGHALGLGHFGSLFITNANQKLHTSPRAVMNAAYVGVLRKPRTTDRAAYCSLYAAWATRR